MALLLCWLLGVVVSIMPLFSTAKEIDIPAEKQLIQRIQATYKRVGRSGRPLLYYNDTFRMEFTLSLVKIIDLDEDNQALSSIIWSRHKWRDPFVAWDPREYQGIKTVRVPVNTIWKPDFILYNNLDDQTAERDSDDAIAMAWIHSDGTVIWIPPNVYKSQCDDHFDSTNFPYDEPQCSFKFGSWAWEAKAFDPAFTDDMADISLVPYIPSQRWELSAHWANKNVAYYSCCPDTPFADLTYTLKLRRGNVQFYQRILIWPMVLLVILTAAPFLLPAKSSSKVIIGAAIFIAFFLYAFVLSDLVGSAAKNASRGAPKIVMCFCIGVMLSAISTFLSALVKDIYECPRQLPNWAKTLFFNVLGPIFLCTGLKKLAQRRQECATRCGRKDANAQSSNEGAEAADAGGEPVAETTLIVTPPEDSAQLQIQQENFETVDNAPLREAASKSSSKCCLSSLTDCQLVAIVINRICFVTLSVAAGVILIMFLPRQNM